MKIIMLHGNGGSETSRIIRDIFLKYFDNPILNKLEDAAVVEGAPQIAMTTDSFVVQPLFFAGGDIGRLCVCGTVNDLAMVGADAKYLTIGFIIEQNTETDDLARVCASIRQAADEAGVQIVAGDTKVIEGSGAGGMYINTSGVGVVRRAVSVSGAKAGDAVMVSGNLGDHHGAILSARMGIDNDIASDAAPLNGLTKALFDAGIPIHAMRDITRGGLAGILNEIADASECRIVVRESEIPVADNIRGLCDVLGLDPFYMGNEGKFALVVPQADAAAALKVMRENKYGENAAIVGELQEGAGVAVHTKIGGKRILPPLTGDGLPRIC